MARLRSSPDDLVALIQQTSDHSGIRPALIEKDFWVTEVLRTVAQPVDGALLIFKGGTSLSKGFGLLERFSEDVDILVRFDEPMGENRRDKLLKAVCERIETNIGNVQGELVESTRGVKRNVRFLYPATYSSDDVREGVLLEMGCRGGTEPRSSRAITSMLSDVVLSQEIVSPGEFDELASFEIECLAPQRTLVEKLALVHTAAVAGDHAALERAGRHAYDILRLLQDPGTRDAVATPGYVRLAAEDAAEHSAKGGWSSGPRPEAGFATSPAFEPSTDACRSLKRGYERLGLLVFGELPEFDQVLEAVAAHREHL